jgi:hypothetical protein
MGLDSFRFGVSVMGTVLCTMLPQELVVQMAVTSWGPLAIHWTLFLPMVVN